LSCKANFKDKDCKLHINVCRWAKVPYPASDEAPIPVKGGILRYHIRNKSKDIQTLIYDVGLNPQVIADCLNDTLMTDMLTNVSLDFVEDMTNATLYRNTVSRRDKMKGPLELMQHSLNDEMRELLPKECHVTDLLLEKLSSMAVHTDEIQELPSLKLSCNRETCEGNKMIEVISSSEIECQMATPKHLISYENDRMSLKVSLPGITQASDINLELSTKDLLLTAENDYHLSIVFDKLIDEDSVVSKFNTVTNMLTVTARLA
jgi:hypothetical protein